MEKPDLNVKFTESTSHWKLGQSDTEGHWNFAAVFLFITLRNAGQFSEVIITYSAVKFIFLKLIYFCGATNPCKGQPISSRDDDAYDEQCSLLKCFVASCSLSLWQPQYVQNTSFVVCHLFSHNSRGCLADLVAEHLDHMHYLNDILSLDISTLNDVLTEHLLNRLLVPLYVFSLADASTPTVSESVG